MCVCMCVCLPVRVCVCCESESVSYQYDCISVPREEKDADKSKVDMRCAVPTIPEIVNKIILLLKSQFGMVYSAKLYQRIQLSSDFGELSSTAQLILGSAQKSSGLQRLGSKSVSAIKT
jgi:hypothetical protein